MAPASAASGPVDPAIHEPLLPREGAGAGPATKPSTLLTVCPFILGNEFCERLAYYGLATNLVVYFKLYGGLSGAGAVSSVGMWSGTCYLTPLIGAWVADSYLGRFKTIFVFTVVYLIGMGLLLVHPLVLAPEAGQTPTQAATALLYGALYLIALGTGGIKPNVSAFGAEQFDDHHPQDVREKQSFFNWFYFSINVGSLISSLVVVYIQENISWGIGFGIPTVALFLAALSFWAGRGRYKHAQPKSSPISRALRVIYAALTTRPAPGEVTLASGDWLDRASLRGQFTRAQVNEVRLVLRVMPVFWTSVMYWTVYQQMSSVFVQQGMQMDRRLFGSDFEIPAASLSTFDTVGIILLVPLFDQGVYPFLAARGYRLTMLQRMGWGLAVSALAMVAGAAVEYQRRQVAVEAGATVPGTDPPAAAMTVFWQTPQYLLIGASEVLASIAQLEFFYDQAPKVMRSCAMALQLLSSALGMYLSAALVWAVQKFSAQQPWLPDDLNEGRLDLYFLLLAALTMFNLMAHVLVSSYYEYSVVEVPGRSYDAPRPPPAGAARQHSVPSAPISFGPASLEADMARSITAMANSPVIPVNMR